MSDQYAIQDPNRFPALLGHSGTAGTAETRRVVAGDDGSLKIGLGSETLMSGGMRPSLDTTSNIQEAMFNSMIKELKKINIQLATLTDNELTNSELV